MQMRMLEAMNTKMSDICMKINMQQTDLVAAVVNAIDANDVRSVVLTLNNFEVNLILFVCIFIYLTNIKRRGLEPKDIRNIYLQYSTYVVTVPARPKARTC